MNKIVDRWCRVICWFQDLFSWGWWVRLWEMIATVTTPADW